MILFVTISVIRCLVLHEVVWFTNLNENIVASVINITALVITIALRIVIHVQIFSKRQFIGYTLFLSDELTLCNTTALRGSALKIFAFSVVALSLFLELYIGIRFKKLSCFRFIPVTIGHLFFIACLIVIFSDNSQNTNYQSIYMFYVVISLQFLFVIKQKDYIIELIKEYRNMLTNTTVTPVNEDLELNDFGIFVGPQVMSDPTFERGPQVMSYTEIQFGGVYMG